MDKLKPCPFCGGNVLFTQVANVRIYRGECLDCKMKFEYEEKEEYIDPFDYIQPNGIRKIRLPGYKVSKPFKEAWNRRSDNA